MRKMSTGFSSRTTVWCALHSVSGTAVDTLQVGYCDTILASLSALTLAPLQIVLQAPVQIVDIKLRDHVSLFIMLVKLGEDYTVSGRHQKYTYLFPFHAKGARVRVRVAVQFGSLSQTG